MAAFCLYLARVYNVTIHHLFPVRGHSFSQCDRNFGLIKSVLKRQCVITTGKSYLEAMVTCRNPPFEVSFDSSLIKNWKELLDLYFLKHPVTKGRSFKIQQYVQIKYKQDGTLLVSNTYSSMTFIPFKFLNELNVSVLKMFKPGSCSQVKIKEAKKKDVRDLYKFMDQESCDWIEQFLEPTTNDTNIVDQDDYISDEEDPETEGENE